MSLPPAVAANPARSRGRLHPESNSGPRGPRDIFQRDRDRLIHSVAFRRLRHKTQVFVAPDGDHYRVRLTHSLEVAQIGRTMARALGLNEDLTEALCLAHDLGHPPFGHAGEDALGAALADVGGFDHNAHTVRIVTRLETPYPDFDGLNLSWEAIEGLAKHNGPVGSPTWAMTEANDEWDLELVSWPGLEAQVAAISDDIAYDNHDIDDGLRAGLLDLDELIALPLVARLWDAIDDRHPRLPAEKKQRALVRDMIGYMVGDVLAETERRVAEAGVETIDEVRAAGRALAGFSDELAAEERELKRFLYARLYDLPELRPVRIEAERVVANLAAAYRADSALLPDWWHRGGDPVQQLRTIGDFIAGMTDRFAIARHEELVGPVTLPASRF
ncbi:MAG TPA: deoxyguanosinetriphosphate triphosphohydrolase [Sphingomicrobium sp.]|nr:deoxyguanosinetriphosphate triphosphohydrolase [Sphingomicrobium sp.]